MSGDGRNCRQESKKKKKEKPMVSNQKESIKAYLRAESFCFANRSETDTTPLVNDEKPNAEKRQKTVTDGVLTNISGIRSRYLIVTLL